MNDLASIQFELNEDGIQELLKSKEMQSLLEQLGAQKAAQAYSPCRLYRVIPDGTNCSRLYFGQSGTGGVKV